MQSINPTTGNIIATHNELSEAELEAKLALASAAFASWRETSFAERSERMRRLADVLRVEGSRLSKIMTEEMGKPIKQADAEIEKCALVCEYYAEHAQAFLSRATVKTDAWKSYVRFDPIGIVLAVMPWNFPFWQVFRFAAPAIMAGNVGVLKHASNVQGCAAAIEKTFRLAGFPDGVFQNLAIGSSKVESVIRDPRLKAVTLTGSEWAGRKVAEVAGDEIKKTVLELGGSDPFIVLEDADLEKTVEVGWFARLQNAGQSCIAAKRFILVESIADEFLNMYKERFESLIIGDPTDEKTEIGPLSSEQQLNDIVKQVEKAVAGGARIVTGGKRIGEKGFFFAPTILDNIAPENSIYREEVFGPVALVIRVKDADEAIRVANDSPFGLGSSIWTKDTMKAEELAGKIEAGCVFINGVVKSDPHLPFGGVKKSGYGRELSEYGIKEFVNVKTVWIK